MKVHFLGFWNWSYCFIFLKICWNSCKQLLSWSFNTHHVAASVLLKLSLFFIFFCWGCHYRNVYCLPPAQHLLNSGGGTALLQWQLLRKSQPEILLLSCKTFDISRGFGGGKGGNESKV